MAKAISFGGKKDLKYKRELITHLNQVEKIMGITEENPLLVMTDTDVVNFLDHLYDIYNTVGALIKLFEGNSKGSGK